MSAPILVSPQGADPVVVDGLLDAPPARVFAAWTDPDEMRAWFGRPDRPPRAVTANARVGGTWRVEFDGADGARDTLHGEYLAVDEAARLVFSWQHERVQPDGTVERTATSRVTVLFQAEGERTRLTITHEAIARESGRIGVGQGWRASLEKLAAHLADPVG